MGAALSARAPRSGTSSSAADGTLITPPFPATVLEWLVEDGDPVSAGQPLSGCSRIRSATGR